MQSIFDAITEWLKGLLVEGIMGNLGGLFTGVNEQVGEIAAQVGMTPAAWNAGVFSMIRQLSETVILPIAGLVLTFVMTYELIQMLIDHNNLHNFDTWIFFKWIFKTFVAVLILSNTFNIVMAVFDVSQQVIQQSAGLIQGSTAVTPDVLNDMQTQLEAMELGPLLGIFLQELIERMERFEHICHALNSLPDAQGQRVFEHYLLNHSVKAIAAAEGVTERAINAAIQRGLENMKKYLEKVL